MVKKKDVEEAIEKIKREMRTDEVISIEIVNQHNACAQAGVDRTMIFVKKTFDKILKEFMDAMGENPDEFIITLAESKVIVKNSGCRENRIRIPEQKKTRKNLQKNLKHYVREVLENYEKRFETVGYKQKISKKVGKDLSKIFLDNRITSNNIEDLSCSIVKI